MAREDWEPDVSAIGALLRARTHDTSGNELGTFTAETRPTELQVRDLIPQAQGDIEDVVGSVPDDFFDRASDLAALGTALLIELSYFPEQVALGTSPYGQYKAMYDERLKRLAVAVAASVDAGPLPGQREPSGSFTDAIPIGYRTPW